MLRAVVACDDFVGRREELARLASFEHPVLRNRAGRDVGDLEARGVLLQG